MSSMTSWGDVMMRVITQSNIWECDDDLAEAMDRCETEYQNQGVSPGTSSSGTSSSGAKRAAP